MKKYFAVILLAVLGLAGCSSSKDKTGPATEVNRSDTPEITFCKSKATQITEVIERYTIILSRPEFTGKERERIEEEYHNEVKQAYRALEEACSLNMK